MYALVLFVCGLLQLCLSVCMYSFALGSNCCMYCCVCLSKINFLSSELAGQPDPSVCKRNASLCTLVCLFFYVLVSTCVEVFVCTLVCRFLSVQMYSSVPVSKFLYVVVCAYVEVFVFTTSHLSSVCLRSFAAVFKCLYVLLVTHVLVFLCTLLHLCLIVVCTVVCVFV